jgi:hypothetical protein
MVVDWLGSWREISKDVRAGRTQRTAARMASNSEWAGQHDLDRRVRPGSEAQAFLKHLVISLEATSVGKVTGLAFSALRAIYFSAIWTLEHVQASHKLSGPPSDSRCRAQARL